ncbi:MAG: hypothetical protein ACRDBO_04050 [Lachnospiraceae bacterium]
MLIRIEYYFGDMLLSGKVRSAGQLKYRMQQTLADTPIEDFIPVFCSRYHYEILPHDKDVKVDYTIDLDTLIVFEQ